MKIRNTITWRTLALFASLLLSACGTLAVEAPTSTPQPTVTKTLVPTRTFTPTATPRPTRTPNLTDIEPVEDSSTRVKKFFDLGYLETIEGRFFQYSNFKEEWAQLGWYSSWPLSTGPTTLVEDFFISARFKWSSAYRNADLSGCGFNFARQPNHNHYAVFLDRSRVYFVVTEYYYEPFSPTRGTGLVDFGNPADQPVQADFTLIVTDAYAYVLVNEVLVGEYTLSKSKFLKGSIGISLLSGTNKDFGTRCEITNIQLWVPNN